MGEVGGRLLQFWNIGSFDFWIVEVFDFWTFGLFDFEALDF